MRFNNRVDPARVVAKYGRKTDPEILDFLLTLFLQNDVPPATRARLADYQKKVHTQTLPVYWSEKDAIDHRVRALCHLVLSLPEFQLD